MGARCPLDTQHSVVLLFIARGGGISYELVQGCLHWPCSPAILLRHRANGVQGQDDGSL